MPSSSDGYHIVITGDASNAIHEIARVEQSINSLLSLQVDSKIENVFGGFLSAIASGFQRVASTAAGVMKSALSTGGGFEAQMTSVKVISGATGEELDKLTAKAREMGATLPINAKDAATAMTLLAQRGTSAKDILASVADVANLAISQGVSMGAAADLLGSTLTNFGIKIDDAAKVTAIFNNASNQSALNMAKLTEALKYVGPTAGSIGMELTEAIAAMEALANAGLTGEMTGTGLAMVLTKLSSSSRVMGVETKDLKGNLRPLADIFSELQAKGFSLAKATAIFGARGRLAALNLAKVADTLKESEENLKDYGTTQGAVDEKAKTFTNTMAAFSSALEELHIEIFDQIKGKSKEAVGGITDIIRALSDWVAKSQLASKSLNAFLDGLGFNIPAGADFKKLLEQLDVQLVVDRVKAFAATIRSIAENVARFADMVKTPLLFLIEHLDIFATISFWGWITGKAMQIPAAIIGLASSFLQLYSAVKALSLANFSSIIAFLSHPALIGVAALAGGIALVTKPLRDVREKIEQEEAAWQQQLAQADASIDLDIQLNVKTGFERLPDSWAKASDEMRDKANATVKALREDFADKVNQAIDAVALKFPELGEAVSDLKESLNSETFSLFTKALQGSKDVFDALPEPMQKVVVMLYDMGVTAGQATDDFKNIIKAYGELQKETKDTPSLSEVSAFSDELTASVKNFVDDFSNSIERLKDFAGSQNIELTLSVSLEQANKQLHELSKSLADKFNIPTQIVDSAIFSKLEILADKGSSTAQALRNSFKGVNTSLDTFLANAQDAISYLNASPEKFTPALNKLASGIQKIDPLTGKVTEQFKKAHDALKQWSNVTFDKLAQRIQRLRSAVEGGFIDKSALEAEFKNASQQVKVKIAAELEPLRGQFSSREAFNSVVASEYVSRMGELGGEAFVEMVQREFDGLYDKSGSAIGAAIMRQVQKGSQGLSSTIKIDGLDLSNKKTQEINSFDFAGAAKAFGDKAIAMADTLQNKDYTLPPYSGKDYSAALDAIVNALHDVTNVVSSVEEAVKALQPASGENLNADVTQNISKESANNHSNSAAGDNLSDALAPIVNSLLSVSELVRAIQTNQQQQSASISSIAGNVIAIERAIQTLDSGSSYDIDIIQQGFNVAQKSDADYVARSAVNALRAGLGNGGV